MIEYANHMPAAWLTPTFYLASKVQTFDNPSLLPIQEFPLPALVSLKAIPGSLKL
jgi:hypothetical protein